MPKTLTYNAPGLLNYEVGSGEIPDKLVVDALLFYEGKHTDSSGRSKTYSAKQLEDIVAASNQRLASGQRSKFFTDHEYGQSNTIGFVAGQFSLQEATAERLPMAGMTELLGKQAIFAPVQISGKENVQQYLDGRIKELSVGIDGPGLFGTKNAIYEVSAVGFPALAGAALFQARKEPEVDEFMQFAERYAVTLADQLQDNAQARAESELWRLWDAFDSVLRDIRNQQTEGTLEGDPNELRSKAIDDLAAQLKARLVTAPPPPPPVVPLFNKTMPEQDKNQNQTPETPETVSLEQFAAVQAELTQMKRRQAIGAQYSKLRRKAEALKSAGKMTPAEFTDLFGDEDAAIEKFSAPDNTELVGLEYHLNQLEKHSAPVRFGSYLSDEPLPSSLTDSNAETSAAEAARIAGAAARYGRLF